MPRYGTYAHRFVFQESRKIHMTKHVAALILAAGEGTRMCSAQPKVLHSLAGRSLVGHVLAVAGSVSPERTVVVIGPGMDAVAKAVSPHPTATQSERLGTAHAVMQAREAFEGFEGTILVLYGDTPLVTPETLARLVEARHGADDPAVVVLGFEARDPTGYGRLLQTDDECLEAIVEHKDATEAQRAVCLCNSGVMALDGSVAFDFLEKIGSDNAKGEFYLTDIVDIARAHGRVCRAIVGDESEFLGINSRSELARAEAIVQDCLRTRAMAQGATLVAPETVFFSWDTVLGRDVVVSPFVTFGPGVTIGDNVHIKGFCHLEKCKVEAGAQIGPYARLRPDAHIGRDAHVGNFVEIKNAEVETGAKVNHLTYIGDARIGARSNIGAGTITCNYDGFKKHHTHIGQDAFIGSNTALVAPVVIGDGAIVGAGSTITTAVAPGALSLTRAPQKTIDGWAAKFRDRMRKAVERPRG